MDTTQKLRRRLPALALLTALTLLAFGLVTVSAVQPDGEVLARIGLRDPADLEQIQAAGVAVYARLTNEDDSYLLAGVTAEGLEALRAQGLEVTVLDPQMKGARYYLVARLGEQTLPALASQAEIVHAEGVQAVVRTTETGARGLAEAGFAIAALGPEPIALQPRFEGAIPGAVQPDPLVAAMIGQVDPATLYQHEEWLTGESPAEIGGEPYTLATRHTYSGIPIQKATQFVYEHLEDLGLEVEYHAWADPAYPNVIATQPGLARSDEIYIISAHLDDMPAGPVAPGADDNASGAAAVLVTADILSQYDFACTLKFTLWTGEEQGMVGSNVWAEWASAQGLRIQGVLNLDMIAHDSDDTPTVDLHARSWLPGSVTMANVFSDVVGTYDLDLAPEVLVDNWLSNYSDNKPFWDEGYSAILAIEDYDDFNPRYHTVNDRLSTLNMPYYTEFVKASLATFVHTSDCLIREGTGHLDGHVREAASSQTGPGSMPIAGASVSFENDAGHAYQATTNSTGYYRQTLPAGTYTVTATADGYQPAVVSDVPVLSGTVSTQDLYLVAKRRIHLPLIRRGD